ncbi:MAG: hypothetical protein MK297_12230 [Planctomycetes bacterium]|nr:hypothetical protein [Planctomycetota bacterium]
MASCHLVPAVPDPLNFPEAKARNLDELHAENGSYRYSANLLGDFGYLIESVTGRDRSGAVSPKTISNPAAETLANLVDLMATDPDSGVAGDLQVQWCARLCVSDPSALVRERAALGLGEVGKWVGVERLRPAPPGVTYATPEEIGLALEGILRGLRLEREGEDNGEALAEACKAALGLDYSLEGAWRLLSVNGELRAQASGSGAQAELMDLAKHLRVVLVEDGLRSALGDPSDLVRAAGVRATVSLFGSEAVTGYLSQPMPGWSDTVILGLVDIVAQKGLPGEDPASGPNAKCVATLVSWAIEHADPRVRARAMLALQRVAPDGPASLREEDWRAWAQSVGLWASPES